MAPGLVAGYMHRYRVNGWPSVFGEPLLVPMLVVLAVVWLLPHNPYPNRFKTALTDHVLSRYKQLPSVHFDAAPSQAFLSRYPANKTALYIEPRADVAFMIPLLLHMMMVVPPDWRFVFFGSKATVEMVRGSYTANMHEQLGKLHIRDLSESWGVDWGRAGWEEEGSISTDEIRSRLLTNSTFYEKELAETEWLLVFHSDAILCANAEDSLDDWLGWDWVGAPWNNAARYGGNGGLSIRRVSKVLEVLEFQKRLDNTNSEDEWMSGRLNTVPGSKMVPPVKAREFAVGDIWHEWPMGYHVNPGSLSDAVWRPLDRRHKIFGYCPEVKIILDMSLDREKCQDQIDAEAKENEKMKKDEDELMEIEKKKLEEENAKLEEERRMKEEQERETAAARKKEKEAARESARARKAAAAAAAHGAKHTKPAKPQAVGVVGGPSLKHEAIEDDIDASSDKQDSGSGPDGKNHEPDEFAHVDGGGETVDSESNEQVGEDEDEAIVLDDVSEDEKLDEQDAEGNDEPEALNKDVGDE